MRMRGTVRLCDEGGCGWPWRQCPTHTPIIAYGIASGLAENFEKHGTCRECGYQLHSPACVAAKDRELAQAVERLSRPAQPAAPAARAGWHAELRAIEGKVRDDRRAAVWRNSAMDWAAGPSKGDSFDCAIGWGRHDFATADETMAYADARLAQEDARRQDELPPGWHETEPMCWIHESGAWVAASRDAAYPGYPWSRYPGAVAIPASGWPKTRDEAMRLATEQAR